MIFDIPVHHNFQYLLTRIKVNTLVRRLLILLEGFPWKYNEGYVKPR
jgi:hypothetical protein